MIHRVAMRSTPVLSLVSLVTLGACTGQTISLGRGAGPGDPPPTSTGEGPPSSPTPLPGGSTANLGPSGRGGDAIALCKPGSTLGCYDGPLGTDLVGACSGGVKTCLPQGKDYGLCEGQIRPSVEICGSEGDENCDGVVGCTGKFLWSERFGDDEPQESRGVAIDSAGNVFLTGSFEGAFELGKTHLAAKGTDVLLTKLDGDGAALWSKRFGDEADQAPSGIAVDTHDKVVLAGSFSGAIDFGGSMLASTLGRDVFLAKLGPSGEHLWSKRFGDSQLQDGYGVTFDSQGNVIVTGRYAGSVDFGGGPLAPGTMSSRLFVAKLDAADGHHLWSRSFGEGPGPSIGYAVATDGEDNVLVTGSFSGSIDFGAGPLLAQGGSDLFVLKLDGMSGVHRWSRSFGDGAEQQGSALSVDGADNVVVTGSFYGAIDFGTGPLQSTGGSNAFLLKLDAGGNTVWSKRFGEHKSARGTASAVAQTGEVVVTGSFDGDADFGGGNLISAGKADGFLAKYRP